MKISAIVCINLKRALGKDGDLLYKISGDLQNFKRITDKSFIIMGRKTWESLPKKPLPNRVNIVVSSSGIEYDSYESFEEIEDMDPIMFKSLEDALCYADGCTAPNEEVFIIGGASLYKEAMEKNYITNLYVTEVFDDTEGDVYFPEFENDKKWKLWFQTALISDSKSDLKYRYKFYRF